jgi:hypothetical protein
MSELLTGVLGFAALFALFGVYALLRPRTSCASGCGSCASASNCELAKREAPGERPG